MRAALSALLLVATAASGLAATESAQLPTSVWQGVYTSEQATRGAAVYVAKCGACHGAAMNGTGEAPALVGGEFISHWDSLTLGDLFDRVRTTMPQNQPKSLSRDEYADVLAYLLQYNGFPEGKVPLDRRSEVLATITITAEKPEGAGR
jgi:mono/diheme cytochrome c family protein